MVSLVKVTTSCLGGVSVVAFVLLLDSVLSGDVVNVSILSPEFNASLSLGSVSGTDFTAIAGSLQTDMEDIFFSSNPSGRCSLVDVSLEILLFSTLW